MLEGKFESALEVLRPAEHRAGGPEISAVAHSLTGDALDGLAKYTEAFAAYTKASEPFQAAFAPIYARPGQVRAIDLAHRLARYFQDAPPARWQMPAREHVNLR